MYAFTRFSSKFAMNIAMHQKNKERAYIYTAPSRNGTALFTVDVISDYKGLVAPREEHLAKGREALGSIQELM